MLPGFRFLFAAIVLSMSMLVFGLGAAALLRAAHEEFASMPLWHAVPETPFAQQGDAATPVLAMLRVDAPAVEAKPSDNIAGVAPTERAEPSTAAAPESISTAKPEDPSSQEQESVKVEIPVLDGPVEGLAAPALPGPPASADETRIVAPANTPAPANETAPAAAPEQASAPAPETDIASTRIATLGGPPVTIEARSPATAGAEPEKSAVKTRHQPRHAARHRRIALRARTVQQASQQPADPFARPLTTARRR